MTDKGGWPKHPMMYRLNSLDWRVPVTFVYGSRTWINRQPALQIKYSRLNSYVDVQVCLCCCLNSGNVLLKLDNSISFNSLTKAGAVAEIGK